VDVVLAFGLISRGGSQGGWGRGCSRCWDAVDGLLDVPDGEDLGFTLLGLTGRGRLLDEELAADDDVLRGKYEGHTRVNM
jgi:hypothetical protein